MHLCDDCIVKHCDQRQYGVVIIHCNEYIKFSDDYEELKQRVKKLEEKINDLSNL